MPSIIGEIEKSVLSNIISRFWYVWQVIPRFDCIPSDKTLSYIKWHCHFYSSGLVFIGDIGGTRKKYPLKIKLRDKGDFQYYFPVAILKWAIRPVCAFLWRDANYSWRKFGSIDTRAILRRFAIFKHFLRRINARMQNSFFAQLKIIFGPLGGARQTHHNQQPPLGCQDPMPLSSIDIQLHQEISCNLAAFKWVIVNQTFQSWWLRFWKHEASWISHFSLPIKWQFKIAYLVTDTY